MPSRRPFLQTLLATVAAVLVWGCGCGDSKAFAWTVIKHEGRDYITAKNIRDFYGFTSLAKSGNTLIFRSPR